MLTYFQKKKKMTSNQVNDLNIGAKSKTLGGKHRRKLHDNRFGNNFLYITTKTQTREEKYR